MFYKLMINRPRQILKIKGQNKTKSSKRKSERSHKELKLRKT